MTSFNLSSLKGYQKIFFCFCLSFLLFSPQNFALNFTVNSAGDTADASPGDGNCDDGSGNCTLRAAMQEIQANGAGGAHTIDLTGISLINAGSNFGSITKNITINGDPAGTTIDLGGNDRMMTQSGGTTTMNNLIIQNCSATGHDQRGGALFASSGSFILNNCVLQDNTCNSSAGGAIAIQSGSSSVVATDCTFLNNHSQADGGAIHNRGRVFTAINCTFAGNSQNHNHGGAAVSALFGATTNLTNCTIVNNTNNGDGGGGLAAEGILNMTNCIVANNTGGSGDFRTINCCGGAASGTISNNIVETCSSSTGNCASYGFINADPNLGDAQICGIQTYFEPLTGSPAIDAGSSAGAPTADICGNEGIGSGKDIGNFEFGGQGAPAPPVPTMGEWALMIFALLIMSLGVVTVMRWQRAQNEVVSY